MTTGVEEAAFTMQGICKSFNGNAVLKGVSLELKKSSIMGLVGENGAGKSTMMNIIGGHHHPENGQMTVAGQSYKPRHPADALDAGIAFIHQELNLFTNLSVAENLFINRFPIAWLPWPHINRKAMNRMSLEWLEQVHLDVHPSTMVENLSPAQRQLVEIAKSISMDARIILFDEPTSSLTEHEASQLFKVIRRLRDQGKSMVYISHNLDDVFNLCDTLTILRDGAVTGGGQTQSLDRKTVVSLMVGRELNQHIPIRKACATGKPVFSVQNLTQKGIVKNINLTVFAGEVVGLFGLVGSGRTELARIIFGLDPHESGSFELKDKSLELPNPEKCIRRKMAFLTENRQEEGLLLDASVHNNMALASLANYAERGSKWIKKNLLRQNVEAMVLDTKVRGSAVSKQTVKTLSGGNQQKVVLGKWLLTNPEFLILDEPTRGIDIGAKHDLYVLMNELVAKGTGILFISSEIEELMGMCDRILVMQQGELKGEIPRAKFNQERILHLALRESAQP